MDDKKFTWVTFYKKLGEELLSYRDNRKVLIKKVEEIFQGIDLSMPTLEKGNQLVDIDPFTIYGLFNKASMTEENRLKIVRRIQQVFSVDAPLPTDFEGIPVVNNLNAAFYKFAGDRKPDDIDRLWHLFVEAQSYSKAPNSDNRRQFIRYFNDVMGIKGIGTSKITIGLFWMNPKFYLNFDSRTEWYIYESGKLNDLAAQLPETDKKISAETYLQTMETVRAYLALDKSPFSDFMDLSSESFHFSQEINKRNKREGDISVNPDRDIHPTQYWTYSPGMKAEYWDECLEQGIMAIRWEFLGDLRQYHSKEAIRQALVGDSGKEASFINDKNTIWQFSQEINEGDIIFAKQGQSRIIGRGIVTSDYYYDDSQDSYSHRHKVNWTHQCNAPIEINLATKTLTNITAYKKVIQIINDVFFNSEAMEDSTENPSYTEGDFLEEVYCSESDFNTLEGLLNRKKNMIIQGPPGVGKTFMAKRLAYALMGEKDPDRVEVIQFHQSYSYEDFMMGYRPSKNGFELMTGVFYNFCKKAEADSEQNYYFIIDEINRGNLSKIFGELFSLLENDKRGMRIRLLYNDEKFSIPSNLYLIGLMNTADRSLALMDYALRRRFAFFGMKPGFKTEGFKEYQRSLDSAPFDALIREVEALNEEIQQDPTLGKDFCLGHSYFCNLEEADSIRLEDILDYEILPLLREYWFDEPDKVMYWSERLKGLLI